MSRVDIGDRRQRVKHYWFCDSGFAKRVQVCRGILYALFVGHVGVYIYSHMHIEEGEMHNAARFPVLLDTNPAILRSRRVIR